MGRKKVEYICKKCGYKTNKKSSYIVHLNRKKPCNQNKINNIESITNQTVSQNKQHKKELEKIKLEMEKYKLESIKYKIDNEILINKRIKDKIENEQIKNKLEEKDKSIKELISTNKEMASTNKNLSQEIKKYKETINFMTNYNNIVINSYGKEDTTHIDMKSIMNDCKTLAEMVAQSIKKKHFSKNKKNHNIMLLRTIAKTYNKEGFWEPKDNIKLFINELIKKGIVNIDDYKKSENIKFKKDKEKRYKKDKKYLIRNIPLACMFNPIEKKRLKEIQENKEYNNSRIIMLGMIPKDEQWDNIELKYKKEIKTASKQLDVKNNLIKHINEAVSKKDIKAGMVGFRYM